MSKIRCFGCMEEYEGGSDTCPHCGYIQSQKVKESYYLEPGTILHAQYLIGRVLGYGGFGVAYMGYDLSLERKVAIKEYMPSDCATRALGETKVIIHDGNARTQYETQLKRFIEEAQKLARYNDLEGVVSIYDCFLENNTGYIVMEYVPYPTLKEKLKDDKKMPYQEAVDIMSQILNTLTIVHKDAIIHRDIAPDNIFVDENGKAKLTDFGAARFASTAHSRSLSIILKPGYAPAEQYTSRGEQGPWTDVYASAATLYRMITGKKPENAYNRSVSFKNEQKDILKKPSEMGIELPENIENAIINALHIQREDRYQSAQEFLDALGSSKRVALKKQTVIKEGKKSYKWVKPVMALLAVAVIGAGIYLVKETMDKPPVVEALPEEVIPDLAGLSYDEAMEKIKDCTLVITGRRYSNSVEYNRILDQVPAVGEPMKNGGQIEIVLSGGVQEIMMPDLLSLTEEEATQLAEGYGLKLSEDQIKREYSDLMQKGRVFGQSVSAGKKVDPNGVNLELAISLGKLDEETSVLTVPDLVGKTRQEADDILHALKDETGFTYSYGQISHENSATVPEGQIMSQSLEAGTEVRTSEAMEIVISDGPKMVEMPDLNLMSKAEADEKIQALNLKAKYVNKSSSNVKKGLVISQEVEAGKQIAEGTTVTITISSGPAPAKTQQTQQNSTSPTPTPSPSPSPSPSPTPTPSPAPSDDLGDWVL